MLAASNQALPHPSQGSHAQSSHSNAVSSCGLPASKGGWPGRTRRSALSWRWGRRWSGCCRSVRDQSYPALHWRCKAWWQQPWKAHMCVGQTSCARMGTWRWMPGPVLPCLPSGHTPCPHAGLLRCCCQVYTPARACLHGPGLLRDMQPQDSWTALQPSRHTQDKPSCLTRACSHQGGALQACRHLGPAAGAVLPSQQRNLSGCHFWTAGTDMLGSPPASHPIAAATACRAP